MKALKFDHTLAEQIKSGEKTSTWRINDDKDISVNDEVRLIDKVNPGRPETWQVFGTARIEKVLEKRLGDVTVEDMEGHAKYGSSEEMVEDFRRHYGEDVTLSTPMKLISFVFEPSHPADVAVQETTPVEAIKLFADGGSRGNPGPSASGFVLVHPDTNKVLVEKGIYLGVTTNNQAEYLALKYGLEEARAMGVKDVDAYMDSLLVVNQLHGTFKVKNRDLWPINEAVKELLTSFRTFRITHVPRELNKLADAAVNRAMDEALGIEPHKNLP